MSSKRVRNPEEELVNCYNERASKRDKKSDLAEQIETLTERIEQLESINLTGGDDPDLVRKSMTLVEFLNSNHSELFYCYGDGDNDSFIYEGLDDLTAEQREHFDAYILDYIYYGKPFNQDVSDPTCEAKESMLATENGWMWSSLRRDDL